MFGLFESRRVNLDEFKISKEMFFSYDNQKTSGLFDVNFIQIIHCMIVSLKHPFNLAVVLKSLNDYATHYKLFAK